MRWPSLSWLGISERATPSKCDFWGRHAPVAMQQGPRSKRGNLKSYPACPSSLPTWLTSIWAFEFSIRFGPFHFHVPRIGFPRKVPGASVGCWELTYNVFEFGEAL